MNIALIFLIELAGNSWYHHAIDTDGWIGLFLIFFLVNLSEDAIDTLLEIVICTIPFEINPTMYRTKLCGEFQVTSDVVCHTDIVEIVVWNICQQDYICIH